MSTLSFVVLFFVQIIFDFYILLLLLRLLLQFFYANYYNPISQFVIKFTNFLVKPVQRILPKYKGIDFAIIVLLLLAEIIQIYLLVWLRFNVLPAIAGLAPWIIGDLLHQIINILFFALIIRAIMSWLSTNMQNPVYEITFVLTEPLLKPIRRFIPHVGNIDLSPLIVAVILKFIDIFLFVPLIKWGQILSLSRLLHS